MAGCVSVPERPKPTPAELAKIDRKEGYDLAKVAEAHLRPVRDVDVQIYLREIATRLVEQDEVLKDIPVGVFLYRDPSHSNRLFSFPGNRIYLSTAWLRVIEFEHELAGGIAVELAHLKLRHLMTALEKESVGESQLDRVRRFSSLGEHWRQWFDFKPDQHQAAAVLSVPLLYGAGFDVRGVLLYEERVIEGLGLSREETLKTKWLTKIKEAVTQLPPIRNPIVKSNRFRQMQKKFRTL
jgi:hypothetical protein